MKNINIIIVIFIALISFLAGCAPAKVPAPVSPPTTEAAVKQVETKAAWEVERERTLERAKKEGTLMVLVTGEPDPVKAVNEGFEKRYGIPVTILSAGTGLVQGKLLSERRAGLYTIDLFFGGGTTAITLKATGAFDPIEKIPLLPEVIDPKVWWGGKLEYLDKDRFILAFVASIM